MKQVFLTESYMRKMLDKQGLVPFVTDKLGLPTGYEPTLVQVYVSEPIRPRAYYHEAGYGYGVYRETGDRVYPKISGF